MGRKIWVLALVIIAAGADTLKENDADTKEEMEIYKVAIDFVDECGSKELSLCVKVSTTNLVSWVLKPYTF